MFGFGEIMFREAGVSEMLVTRLGTAGAQVVVEKHTSYTFPYSNGYAHYGDVVVLPTRIYKEGRYEPVAEGLDAGPSPLPEGLEKAPPIITRGNNLLAIEYYYRRRRTNDDGDFLYHIVLPANYYADVRELKMHYSNSKGVDRVVIVTRQQSKMQTITFICKADLKDFVLKIFALGPDTEAFKSQKDEEIIEVDHSEKPQQSSAERFPANIINIGTGYFDHSPLQQAGHDANQTVNITQNGMRELREIIEEIRGQIPNLPAEKQEEARADLQIVEIQAKSQQPKVEKIKQSLKSIKDILEGVGNVVAAASPFALKIAGWISGAP